MKKTFGIITAIVISMFVGITSVSAAEKPTLKVKGNYVDNKIGIELRWNEVESADYYRIQRKESSDTKFTTLIDTKVLSSNDYYKGALPTKAGKYTYRIVTKVDGNWIYSNKLTVTIKGKSTIKAEEKKPEIKQNVDVKKSDEKPKTSFEIANSADYVFPYQVGDTPGDILKSDNNGNLNDWTNYTDAYNLGTLGECVWYAKGRFYELHGICANLMWFGENKIDWLKNIQKNNVDYVAGSSIETHGSVEAITDINDIRNQCIAVFASNNNTGHVVFVEYVDRDKNGKPINVYFTEANGPNDLKKGRYDFGYDGIVTKCTFDQFVNLSIHSNELLMGYIIPKDYPKN